VFANRPALFSPKLEGRWVMICVSKSWQNLKLCEA